MHSSCVPPVKSHSASAATLQSSPLGARAVWTQCCMSRSHSRSVPSLDTLASAFRPGSRQTSVTASRWPRRRQTPASPTTSHTTTFVSCEPEASSVADALKCSAVTALLCPVSTVRSSPSERRHRWMVPLAWPAASVSPSLAKARAVTSEVSPGRPPGGTRRCTMVCVLMSHTITASSAGVIASLPVGSTTTCPPPDTTTPHDASCTYLR